jgi:hypothetical protein
MYVKAGALLLLLVVDCSKSGAGDAPAPPVASTPSKAEELPTPPPAAPRIGSLAICNKIVSTGAASNCHRGGDGGNDRVQFDVKGRKDAGSIFVFSEARYRAALNTFEFKDVTLVTSDPLRAVVFWTPSGELIDAQIRLGVTEAEGL